MGEDRGGTSFEAYVTITPRSESRSLRAREFDWEAADVPALGAAGYARREMMTVMKRSGFLNVPPEATRMLGERLRRARRCAAQHTVPVRVCPYRSHAGGTHVRVLSGATERMERAGCGPACAMTGIQDCQTHLHSGLAMPQTVTGSFHSDISPD